MRLRRTTIFYHTCLLTLSSVALQILGFIYRIGLSRCAGAEAVGVYQLVMPVYSVIQSLTLSGVTVAVSSISAQRRAFGDYTGVKKLVRTGIGFFLIAFALTCIPFALGAAPISSWLCSTPQCAPALLLLLPCLFLTGFENIYKNCFYGIKSVFEPIFSELLEHIVRIIAVLGLLLFFANGSPTQAAALIVCGMIVGEIFSSSALSILYRRNVGRRHGQGGPKVKSYWKEIAAIAFPVAASGVLNNIIASATTLLIPQRLILSGVDASQAMSAFGIMFGMTFPLLMLPSAFLNPLTMVLIPKFSENVALHRDSDIRRKASKALHVTGLIAAPCMAILIPLREPLCQALYGEAQASQYILPLALSTIFLFYQIVTGSILNGIQMQKHACASVILSGIVELGVTYFTVSNPRLRLFGYVLACLISSIAGCLMNVCFVKRAVKFKIRWRNWFFTPYFSAVIASLFCRFVYYFLLSNSITGSLCLISAIVCALLSYLGLLRLQGINFPRYLRSILEEAPGT